MANAIREGLGWLMSASTMNQSDAIRNAHKVYGYPHMRYGRGASGTLRAQHPDRDYAQRVEEPGGENGVGEQRLVGAGQDQPAVHSSLHGDGEATAS